MKQLLAVTAILMLTSAAHAASVGPAGCGLGNMVFGKDNQILASTTNGTSGNQTFGITSGTSNCGAGGLQSAVENFVEVNQIALTNDMSRGQGDTIVSLSKILGCPDHQQLGQALKSNYTDVFGRENQTPAEITNGVEGVILKDPALRNSCGNV